jgi:hypothetical protein
MSRPGTSTADCSKSTLVSVSGMEHDTAIAPSSCDELKSASIPPVHQRFPPPNKTPLDLPSRRRNRLFAPDGALRPGRLLSEDIQSTLKRYPSDWFFNQLILASAVYLFFTNLLPGITFASDLYVLTKQHYGAIEVVFSTGLCGVIFALCVPLHRI